MRGHQEIPMIDGDEVDALTSGKNYYHWKPGTRKKIKRAFNKRLRRFNKATSCGEAN